MYCYARTMDGTGRPTHFSAANLAGTQYFDARIVWSGMNQKEDEWDKILDAERTNIIKYQFGGGVLMRDKAVKVRRGFIEWLSDLGACQIWTDDMCEQGIYLSHLGLLGHNVMDLSTAAFLMGVNWEKQWANALKYVRNQQDTNNPGHYARVGITVIKRIKNGFESGTN